MTKTINLIWQVEPDQVWEKDWLNFLLKDFQVNLIIDLNYQVYLPNALIVTPGRTTSGQPVDSYFKTFQEKGYKVGVFHLSEEWNSSPAIQFYPYADFIFRNYYRSEVSHLKNCQYFALGYKSGFTQYLIDKDINSREYRWFFAGQPKGSRYQMIEAAQRISGGKFHLTGSWNDAKGLSTQEYAEYLNNSVFALCPGGNCSLDTFRVYEALEAGAIPIVEDWGGFGIWREVFSPQNFIKIKAWKRSYWQRNYPNFIRQSYWQKAYQNDFPCPTIHHWETLDTLLTSLDPQTTSEKVRAFWQDYKHSLVRLISDTIIRTFNL